MIAVPMASGYDADCFRSSKFPHTFRLPFLILTVTHSKCFLRGTHAIRPVRSCILDEAPIEHNNGQAAGSDKLAWAPSSEARPSRMCRQAENVGSDHQFEQSHDGACSICCDG